MAAGLGYIEFATGDILTAAVANGYLASQTVMVFADSSARSTAITSPQEGMISYLKDTNAVEYYSGSAWAAVGGGATGGMTLLSTTSLTSSSILLSSISGSYNELWIYITDFIPSTGGNYMTARFNDDSTANYHCLGNTYGVSATSAWNSTSVQICAPQNGGTANNLTILRIPSYANADTYKIAEISSVSHSNESDNDIKYEAALGFYRGTSAISSIRLAINSGTFSGGTVKVYGVK